MYDEVLVAFLTLFTAYLLITAVTWVFGYLDGVYLMLRDLFVQQGIEWNPIYDELHTAARNTAQFFLTLMPYMLIFAAAFFIIIGALRRRPEYEAVP